MKMINPSSQNNTELPSKEDIIHQAPSERVSQSYFRRLRLILIIALIAFSVWVVLLGQYPKSISFDKAILALLATWLCFYPSIQYLSDPKRPPIPFFPLVGIFYALTYSLPIFKADDMEAYSKFSLQQVSQEALILLVIGLINMNFAFFLSQKLFWRKVYPMKLPSIGKTSSLLFVAWLFLLIYLFYTFTPFLKTIPSIGYYISALRLLSFGLFYILWSEKKLKKLQTYLVLGFFILELLLRFSIGSLAQPVFFLLFCCLVIWYQNKRLPITLLFIAALVLIIFNPVKGEYRSLTWNDNTKNISLIDKSRLFVDLAIKHYFSPDNNPRSGFADSFITRTSQIELFSKVIEDTPNRVPYWNGETYYPLVTSFIPRILLPNKPQIRTGNDFGQRYGYLDRNDFSTSFNLPWIVEMYANFGHIGVILGMLFVGLLLGFLNKKFNSNGMSKLEFLTGAVILNGLTTHTSNFALETGGTFLTAVSIYITFKFLALANTKAK